MQKFPQILIVDDDQEICQLLALHLKQHKLSCVTANDGQEMLHILKERPVDLIVLDVMLPGEDGFSLCKKVRALSQVPIIMLTAVDDDSKRIRSLNDGADDYQLKPFNPDELAARINAVLRRAHTEDEPVINKHYEFAGWRLDTQTRQLFSADGVEIIIGDGEYELLLLLITNAGHVVSRDFLLEATKNRSATPFDRAIDMTISRLRHKIEVDAKDPQLIKTVRNAGYIFTPKVDSY